MVVTLTASINIPHPHLSAAGGRWLVTLVTSFAFSLVGLLVPNLYRQSSEELFRAHNGVKFLNEFLARHLLVYVTYFMALSLTASFVPEWEWVKTLMTLVVAITIGCYSFGVYNSTHQDRFFAHHHGCAIKRCRIKISREDIWNLCWPNAIMAGVLFLVAFSSIFLVQ